MYKVLVVEDEDFLIKMYDVGLKHEGFEVFSAEDGEKGLALAKEKKPDIILLDLIMPNKNGFEVLEDLKKDPVTQSIPVYILSNLGQEVDVERVKQLGAETFLRKDAYTVKEVAAILNKRLAMKA